VSTSLKFNIVAQIILITFACEILIETLTHIFFAVVFVVVILAIQYFKRSEKDA
jgi:hypothetical protein